MTNDQPLSPPLKFIQKILDGRLAAKQNKDINLDDYTPKRSHSINSFLSSYIAHELNKEVEGLGDEYRRYTYTEIFLPKDSNQAVYKISKRGGAEMAFEAIVADKLTNFLQNLLGEDGEITTPKDTAVPSYRIETKGDILDKLIEGASKVTGQDIGYMVEFATNMALAERTPAQGR